MNKNLIRFKTATGKTVVVELFESVGYPPELYIYYEESDQNIAMIPTIFTGQDAFAAVAGTFYGVLRNLCTIVFELYVFSYKHRLFHHLTFVRATRFGLLNPTLLTGDSR